jgi:acetoin utilization protein AcuB
MTPDPVSIRLAGTLREALELMDEHNCRHLPVVNANDKLIGIVSDRDCRLAVNSPHLMRERWQDEEVIDHTQVAAMMTRDPITVAADAPLQDAIALMRKYRVSALPVLDNDELVGIISTVDLLDALVSLLDKQG